VLKTDLKKNAPNSILLGLKNIWYTLFDIKKRKIDFCKKKTVIAWSTVVFWSWQQGAGSLELTSHVLIYE